MKRWLFYVGVLAGSAMYLAGATVSNLAGTGEAGFSGDGGSGVTAQLANPYGVEIGPDGALYICEVDNHRIRRLDLTSGIISTVAGNGTRGYSGDGGPAVEASLNQPYEVRFDGDGNMYLVEMMNNIVRRMDSKTGKISTVAGTGERGFLGDGGPATQAHLNRPHSIALDSNGSLYIADIGNHRIRRVDLKSGVIETFAGTGERAATPDGARLAGTPLHGPRAMAFDRRGDMYVALREGNAVYRIDMQKRTLHHVAGTGQQGYAGDYGPAKKALLSGPKGIAIGPEGGIYLADTESHTVRRIDPVDGLIVTILGDSTRHDGPDGHPLHCGLSRPHGVYAGRDGAVYVGDSENHRVRVLKHSR